jgi:putative peptidoglycan lipid II flippase
LVLGGYALAVATALLPLLSHHAAAGDYESLKTTLTFAIRIVSFITVPAAVGLVVLREPIIRVLFEHGEFMAASTGLTGRALLYYALGLPAFAAIKLIVPGFYSAHDTGTPARIAAYAVALNIVLNVLCLAVFFPVFGNGGPAIAAVISAYFNFFALFGMFRLRYGRMGTVEILASLGRVGVCSAVMGVVCWGALRFSGFGGYADFFPRLAIFAALIAGAVATYLVAAWMLRCREIREFYDFVLQPREPAVSGLVQ